MLTKDQQMLAIELLIDRPTVIAGTRVIADEKLRGEWYALVTKAMHHVGITEREDVKAFCDLAGVPD